MDQSENLHSGQVLKIPTKIFHFKKSDEPVQSVLQNPFCEESVNQIRNKSINLQSDNQDTSSTEPLGLEEFRSAFESLITEEKNKEQEEIQAQAEQQIFIELDGLVMDETRSKIGRDFYDIFFQQWEAPPNSNNFSIMISEQPTPSLGSIVSVSVNDEQIFQYRLQPRYEVIEQVANYAVRFTYNYMLENKHQYKIY